MIFRIPRKDQNVVTPPGKTWAIILIAQFFHRDTVQIHSHTCPFWEWSCIYVPSLLVYIILTTFSYRHYCNC